MGIRRRLVVPVDDRRVPRDRGQARDDVEIGYALQAPGVARVGLGVVVDEPSSGLQVRRHELLYGRRAGQQLIWCGLGQLAGRPDQAYVDRHEDGDEAAPRQGPESWPDPNQHRRADAERQSDCRRFADGVGDGRAQRHARHAPGERAGRHQGPDGQARHRSGGNQRHDPVVAGQGLPQPGRLRAIDPAREEHADRGGNRDHVAALQTLVPVERQAVEQMFKRRVRARARAGGRRAPRRTT